MSEQNKFSKDFLWGAATSSHQVEGGTHNNWSEWEQSPERIADLKKRGLHPSAFISGRACDHYHRFREDFDIAQSLGHNAHRFSIEWSRIEPQEGKFDEKEIEHYREVIKALKERGMEPFVTLWHWTLPLWMRDAGGWENTASGFYFARYCEKMANEFKNEVKFWLIINEPQYWVWHAYVAGVFPPQKKNIISTARVYRNLIHGHKEAYIRLKAIDPHAQIGIVESTGWLAPFIFQPFQSLRNFLFPMCVRGYFDFFGLNYYRKNTLMGRKEKNISEIGWEIYPEGLYRLLTAAHRKFKKPIFVTENGIADAKDEKRAAFIRDHVMGMKKAMDEGADVRGYFYWSLLDNFEWDSGFGPRFGLVEVDYTTLERKIRPSARAYQELMQTRSA